MLILSRRVNESIVIGDDITLTILSVKGKQVRIGVNAPLELSVHREEIYQRLAREMPDTPTPALTTDEIWDQREAELGLAS